MSSNDSVQNNTSTETASEDVKADTIPAESTEQESQKSPDLSMILDIPVELSLEVGRTQQTVEQVLALAQGSVIELNRKAGEPLDVKVNGTLIAHGEVVESQGKYGIRILDVVGGTDRVGNLL
ncbi:MAG: flagellar motor switch protein FliN [Endozoicomonas sp.]